MAVSTYSVRSLAVKGKERYGHDERALAKAQRPVCDFVRLSSCRKLEDPT